MLKDFHEKKNPPLFSTYPALFGTYPALFSTYPALFGTYPALFSTYSAQFSTYPAQFSTYPAQFSTYPALFSTYPALFSTYPALFSTYPALPLLPRGADEVLPGGPPVRHLRLLAHLRLQVQGYRVTSYTWSCCFGGLVNYNLYRSVNRVA